MFNEHILRSIVRIPGHSFCCSCSQCSQTPFTGWECSCLSVCALWFQQWEFLAFFREWPLGYRCCCANTTSRDPEYLAVCPLVQAVANDWWVWMYESVAPMLPSGTHPVVQCMWNKLCDLGDQAKVGTLPKLTTSRCSFPLSWFLHSFTISPGSSSWIKEELNKLVHMSPHLRLCFWRTQPRWDVG